MSTIISISTFWGSRYGGVNVFNLNLIKALAKNYPNHYVVNISLNESRRESIGLPPNLQVRSVEADVGYIYGFDNDINDVNKKSILNHVNRSYEK